MRSRLPLAFLADGHDRPHRRQDPPVPDLDWQLHVRLHGAEQREWPLNLGFTWTVSTSLAMDLQIFWRNDAGPLPAAAER